MLKCKKKKKFLIDLTIMETCLSKHKIQTSKSRFAFVFTVRQYKSDEAKFINYSYFFISLRFIGIKFFDLLLMIMNKHRIDFFIWENKS